MGYPYKKEDVDRRPHGRDAVQSEGRGVMMLHRPRGAGGGRLALEASERCGRLSLTASGGTDPAATSVQGSWPTE